MTLYDYIIIGGGISGLATCMKLPNTSKILCLEQLSRFGGRIHSKHIVTDDGTHIIEKGAARFHKQQQNIMNMLTTLQMTDQIVPYPSDIKYTDNTTEGPFQIIKEIIHHIQNDKKEVVSTYTFLDYAKSKLSKSRFQSLTSNFEYMETIQFMNAYEVTKIIHNYDPSTQYFTLKEGLSSCIDKMVDYIRNKHTNVDLKSRVSVLDVLPNHDNQWECITDNKTYRAKKVIFTIPGKFLGNFSVSSHFKSHLDSVHYRNLNRVYGLYDKKEPWMNYERIKTNENNKYMISHGKMQLLSYTDGKMADYWFQMNLKDKTLDEIHKCTETIFTKTSKPKQVFSFYWKNGLGIWKPGTNINEVRKQMINPLPNLYIGGDTFSAYQNWIDGALENTNAVVDYVLKDVQEVQDNVKIPIVKVRKPFNAQNKAHHKAHHKDKTRRKQNSKTFSLEEVKHHNTKKDAWIAIGKSVYDITSWIPLHPGGDIIMKYVGKDATQIFNQLHPSYVKKDILIKYKIGNVKNVKTRKRKTLL